MCTRTVHLALCMSLSTSSKFSKMSRKALNADKMSQIVFQAVGCNLCSSNQGHNSSLGHYIHRKVKKTKIKQALKECVRILYRSLKRILTHKMLDLQDHKV